MDHWERLATITERPLWIPFVAVTAIALAFLVDDNSSRVVILVGFGLLTFSSVREQARRIRRRHAFLAQGTERRAPDAKVPGSIPGEGSQHQMSPYEDAR